MHSMLTLRWFDAFLGGVAAGSLALMLITVAVESRTDSKKKMVITSTNREQVPLTNEQQATLDKLADRPEPST
jgi:hypothetical protein